MAYEIERKFLINRLPNLWGLKYNKLFQAYLDLKPIESRIRSINNEKFYYAVKMGEGIKRIEKEKEINKKTFDLLFPLSKGKTIEKTRYYYPMGTLTIEIDIYEGALSGLVVAEVEFPTIEDASEFMPPIWFGKEITFDNRFKNANLATLQDLNNLNF